MVNISAKRLDPVAETRGRPLADAVLELIWRERRVSRAGIARMTGLSRSTVSKIVAAFPATLVAEAGDGPSRGGRRPVILEFQDNSSVILGVDLGATHVSVVLTNLRGRILACKHKNYGVRSDPVGTAALMVRVCQECLDESPGPGSDLLGIGIGVPSPVDPLRPDRLSEVVYPAWRGHSLSGDLMARYGVPVLVDNDANLGALAEYWWGGAVGVDNFNYVKVGTGVGSGQMIRGEIYRGATGVAGEIGHLAIDPGGRPCVCGNRGCLATFVGTAALMDRTAELLADFPDSVLNKCNLSLSNIESAVRAGDSLALKVIDEAVRHLGIAIAGVLNLMNPSMVIIGGSLSGLGDRLLVPLREAAFRRTLVSSVAAAEIRTSSLGPQAIALGASTQVLATALANPRLFPGVRPA